MIKYLIPLLLIACGGTEYIDVYVAPEASSRPRRDVWLSDDHPLRGTQNVWGLPLPKGITYSEKSWDEIQQECDENDSIPEDILGCAKYAQGEIIVWDAMNDRAKARVRMHELGHFLRAAGGHLPCADVNHDIMCRYFDDQEPYSLSPTKEDFWFVNHPEINYGD